MIYKSFVKYSFSRILGVNKIIVFNLFDVREIKVIYDYSMVFCYMCVVF